MRPPLWLLASLALNLCQDPVESCAAKMRNFLLEGDRLKVRLESRIDGRHLETGDSITVRISEFRRDPAKPPEIDEGTPGVVYLKLVDKNQKSTTFDVSSIKFIPNETVARTSTRLRAVGNTAGGGVIEVKKPSFLKKLFLPPLMGFFFWHSKGSIESKTILELQVTKKVEWFAKE